MPYGWLHGDDDRGVGTMGELVAIGVSHGRNIRHKWRGFRPNAGIDNNHGVVV